MPIYSYRCTSCGNQKDVLQKISDSPLDICPVCGAAAFRKQVTAAGFQLKGSGWYVTDFRNPAAKPATAKPDQGADQSAGAPAVGAADTSAAETTKDAATATKAGKTAAADSAGAAPSKAASTPAPASGSDSSATR